MADTPDAPEDDDESGTPERIPMAHDGPVIDIASEMRSAYLYYVYNGGAPWLGIDHLRFGMIGMPASLIAMVVVTLMTPAPDEETQRMVDEVRLPSGETILGGTH